MNTFLVLMLATSATAGDPLPLPVGPANPPPVILVSDTEWAEPAPQPRPRLFGKIRSYVKGKWTQLTDRVTGTPTDTVTSDGTVIRESGNGVTPVKLIPTNSPRLTPRAVWTDSSPEPPLAESDPSGK